MTVCGTDLRGKDSNDEAFPATRKVDRTWHGGIHDHADDKVANRGLGSLSPRTVLGERGVFLRVGLGSPRPRVPRERACGGSARRSLRLGVWCAASLWESSGAARERTCGDEHVGQHVDSQVLDVTKVSQCTGIVSSALASGDAGERTQVRTVENKEEFTAAPTRTSDR